MKLRASGGEGSIDFSMAFRFWEAFAAPGEAHQIMTLPGGDCAVIEAGDQDRLRAELQKKPHCRFYASLHPVRPDLASNMKVGDALYRRWLHLDVDPKKADPEAPADEAEHTAAMLLATDARNWLTRRGWPEPLTIDTGNGYALLYRTDWPNDEASRLLTKDFLAAISGYLKAEGAVIDTARYPATGAIKIPGTWNRKGTPTKERPYRQVRLAMGPDVPVVVTAEQVRDATFILAGLTGKREQTNGHTNGHAPKKKSASTLKTPRRDRTPYVTAAVRDECDKVLNATPGDGDNARNPTLNRAAFALGQLVGGGHLPRHEAEAALMEAATAAGLPEQEARGTIKSGLDAGEKEPREIPEQARPTGKATGYTHSATASAEATTDDFPDGVTITGNHIPPKAITWLWPGRVAANKLTTFAGIGGLGKTFVLCDVTARITAGLPWPDCQELAPQGRVIFVSGEDDPDDTLIPRLLACGADVSRVHFLREEALDALNLANLDLLERAVGECKGECRLIVIDPPTAYLGGVDDHKNTELRSLVLSPLKRFAARLNVGVAFNTHVNKGSGAKVEAAMRVMGSVAWVNGVRSANIFAKDPDDPARRLMVPLKINIGKEMKGLAFRLESLPEDRARVLWLPGDVDVTADQAMNREPNRPRRVVAAEWLVERFREKLEWESDDLFKAGRQVNLSRDAIFEAKAKLDLPRAQKRTYENGDAVWVWWVPDDWPHLQDSATDATVATDEDNCPFH